MIYCASGWFYYRNKQFKPKSVPSQTQTQLQIRLITWNVLPLQVLLAT